MDHQYQDDKDYLNDQYIQNISERQFVEYRLMIIIETKFIYMLIIIYRNIPVINLKIVSLFHKC